MVFKRRTKRGFWQTVAETIYPRGGWRRAASYIIHRVRRLPDQPHRIARGIGAGVFVCFTPFYGLHFAAAALVSLLIRGNVIASLLATFFGNPITFPIIAALSIRLGGFILGTEVLASSEHPIHRVFAHAIAELWDNIFALFTTVDTNWTNLIELYREVFLPYLVGGLVPGLIAGYAAYALSLPVISVYQKRRKGRLKAKFEEMRNRRRTQVDDSDGS